MGAKTVALHALPEELAKIYDTLMKQARKTQVKTTRQAGTFMLKKAALFAPYLSGETVAGLDGHKEGKNYVVISDVASGGFPQNVWADGRIVGMKDQVPYSWRQVTGIAGGGFFTKAEEVTNKEFINIVTKDVSFWETVK